MDADILILGTGVSPRTEILSNSNITLDNRSVKCNAFLQTSDENIYAAGDCCSFPYPPTGERVYIIVNLDLFCTLYFSSTTRCCCSNEYDGESIIF